MLYVHVVILKRVCEPETKLPKGGGKKKKNLMQAEMG
jgi:hypothetical protein